MKSNELKKSIPSTLPQDSNYWAKLGKLLVSENIVLLPPEKQVSELDDAEKKLRKSSALTVLKNWDAYGFVLCKKDMLELCQKSMTSHAWIYEVLTPALKEKFGGHTHMRPMYPNFPDQVMKMDEAELYFNAMIHYLGSHFGLSLLPETEEAPRKPLKNKDVIQHQLQLVPFDEVKALLVSMLGMKSVWTPQQKELIQHALPLLLNDGSEGFSIPSVENRAQLSGYWLNELAGKEGFNRWPASGVSVTDVLRAVVVSNGGDASLSSASEKVKVPKLSRPKRRLLVQTLERAAQNHYSDSVDDLFVRRGHWLSLAHALHVGEWKSKAPLFTKMIEVLRSGSRPPSWNSQFDGLMGSKFNALTLKELAFSNPGYFVRNLRRSLLWASTQENQNKVLSVFKSIAPVVSTQLLMDVKKVCESNPKSRMVMPKGNFSAHYVLVNDVSLSELSIKKIKKVHDEVLLERFSNLPALGKVHVDAAADGVLLPKGLRDNSSDTASISRGSSVKMGEQTGVIRMFLWWKGQDIDLTAIGLDKNFRETESCNYHNLRNSGLVHSGDITWADQGAAEFIDVELSGLREQTRYIGLAAHVFSGPTFKQHEECFVGWQERIEGREKLGKIMDIRTVVNKTPVESNSKAFIAAMFDVKERKFIWLDAPFYGESGHSLLNQTHAVCEMMEAMKMYSSQRPNMKDLTDLHILARGGKRVKSAEKADTLFTLNDVVGNGSQTVYSAMFPRTFTGELLVGPSEKDYLAFSEKKELLIAKKNKGVPDLQVHVERFDLVLEKAEAKKSAKKNRISKLKAKARSYR